MKKSVFILALSILSTLFAANLYAKTITGTVTDAVNNRPLEGVLISIQKSSVTAITNQYGKYSIEVSAGSERLIFSLSGYHKREIDLKGRNVLNVALNFSKEIKEEYVGEAPVLHHLNAAKISQSAILTRPFNQEFSNDFNTETYNGISENRFHSSRQTPLSTFGIDVDGASYGNIRRYINNGNLPPIDAVRIEEMINYFSYEYPQPQKNQPFSVNTEISAAPWNSSHKLLRIGLQGKKIGVDNLPASNLVFLIDVSGSMNQHNKLPLVKSSIKLLVDQLRKQDKVSIVVYAGAAGMVLPPTSGDKKETIKNALDRLPAGGSTAGGDGIKLAYKIAQENFLKRGNNRVILASDGDFNTGVSSDGEMQRLIEEKRKGGVFLTVLGYGMGNYKDSKMETLANKGNGNYAYIDNISEARKVLINEFGGTLFTIAKDVKLQLEFNPEKVQAYRLIGYENRLLNNEDFNNDQKDAGDLGSGHRVTALYEIIPAGVKSSFIDRVDELKYQSPAPNTAPSYRNELLTIKLRYKEPDSEASSLITQSVTDRNTNWKDVSGDFRFSAAVAAYGMLLRQSEFSQQSTYDKVIEWARSGLGEDEEGYRNEFLQLVKSSKLLARETITSVNEKD